MSAQTLKLLSDLTLENKVDVVLMSPVESLLDTVPSRLSMPYTGPGVLSYILYLVTAKGLRCDAAGVPCDACAICMRPVETSWSMQCMLCRSRIHSWCAPSPYDDILCRFCVQHSHGIGMSFGLHNVLMRPGFEISGCAEAAAVASAEDVPVITVPSSPGDVDR